MDSETHRGDIDRRSQVLTLLLSLLLTTSLGCGERAAFFVGKPSGRFTV